MDERERAADARHRGRPRWHHAARRLSRDPLARQPGVGNLRRDRNLRAPPPPLRGQHRLQGSARAAWHALLRHVARRPLAGDDRVPGSPLVHRRAIPPRAEIAAVRAAPAVLLLHRRGRGPEPAGLTCRSASSSFWSDRDTRVPRETWYRIVTPIGHDKRIFLHQRFEVAGLARSRTKTAFEETGRPRGRGVHYHATVPRETRVGIVTPVVPEVIALRHQGLEVS